MRPQTIVERLDFVAKRIPGLKFTPPTQLKPGDDQYYGCFMSCDMYYIEIKVDQSHQSVKDVIISHGNNADGFSCPVLRKVLADQDFETFAKHLSGLHSIYQINTNDKKVKQRAYSALTSLENDLSTLYDIQRRKVSNCHDLVHKSPIGLMEPRKGGLPVRLTYFITPYDLVDITQRVVNKPTADTIMTKSLGLSATVEIEGSNPHKIQVRPLIMQSNSSLPAYAAFNSQNSEKLPAQFVLKLSQPFPMLVTSITQIMNEITEPSTIKDYFNSLTTNSRESIIALIARQELDLNKGPFCRTLDAIKSADIESCDLKRHVYSVKLPDQAHTYHVLDSYLERPEGVYVTKLPFTHPTSIPSILKILRQQALFNFVLGSCIRRSKQSSSINITDTNNQTKNGTITNIFDVIPVSLNNICISFEHPSKESLATLEIDFRELNCQLYALDKDSVCSDEFATKVLQKCWSIPITLRSVIKKCNEKRLAMLEDSHKRRERELHEILSDNANAQLKSSMKYQDSLLQSKFNSQSEKTNPRDLNSVTEFLVNKANAASTSNINHNNNSNSNSNNNNNNNNNELNEDRTDPSNRTNFLKKFSCKPRVKQSVTTKSQPGNKILSLMLKRTNSAVSPEDQNPRGPILKKVKTKHSSMDATNSDNSTGLLTTKLITPEAANAARLANKQAKQLGAGTTTANQNVSISLIRSPSKAQALSTIATSMSNQTSMTSNLISNSNQKLAETSGLRINDIANNIKMKAQANGANAAAAAAALLSNKPRKSSICALLDHLVGDVTPDRQLQLQQQQQQQQNNMSAQNSIDHDSKVGTSTSISKSKSSRLPGGDQFAIKQGSSGGGLKLTVTKTKPSTPQSSTTTTATQPTATTITSGSTTSTQSTATNAISSATSNASVSTNSSSPSVNSKSESASKAIDLGSSTPSIRYTIPKISKSQQASQSLNTTNESSNSNDSQGDDSNPSSTANATPAASSSNTTAKQRTTSNPFKQTSNTVRSSVSSSTHPPNRTTSNPLANLSRASSTQSNSNASNDINLQNRISSSNNGVMNSLINQQVVNIARQQQQQQAAAAVAAAVAAASNRPLGLAQTQQSMTQAPIVPALQQLPNIQHMMNPAILGRPQVTQQAQQSIRQQVAPLFSPRLPNQQNAFQNPNDLNLMMASQAALLNQQKQKQLQIQQQQQQLLQQTQQHIKAVQQLSGLSSSLPTQQQQQQQVSSVQSIKPMAAQQQQQARVSSSTEPRTDYSTSSVPAQSSSSSSSASATASASASASASATMTTTTSTPSSPTECGQAETVAPPPLIPIDSLDETNIASPDAEANNVDDDDDDESDRLSIVDMNEAAPECNSSAAGTPKPSQVESPMEINESSASMVAGSAVGGSTPVVSTVVVAATETAAVPSSTSSSTSLSTSTSATPTALKTTVIAAAVAAATAANTNYATLSSSSPAPVSTNVTAASATPAPAATASSAPTGTSATAASSSE